MDFLKICSTFWDVNLRGSDISEEVWLLSAVEFWKGTDQTLKYLQAEVQSGRKMPLCAAGRGERSSYQRKELPNFSRLHPRLTLPLMLLHTQSQMEETDSFKYLLCTYQMPTAVLSIWSKRSHGSGLGVSFKGEKALAISRRIIKDKCLPCLSFSSFIKCELKLNPSK